MIKFVQNSFVLINIQKATPKKRRGIKHQREKKDYKFEFEYCDFKSDCYNLFLDHINSNHLESDEEDV